jgi:uncharacterized protein YbjT (DUF2867 family)
MSERLRPILVFGATGQQGGSVATALLKAGWSVRAFVRDPASSKAAALRSAGAELVKGDFADKGSMRSAMAGAYGVFSVQPSSGQGPVLGVSDEDEERYGAAIANLARDAGVQHLVYASVGAPGDEPTGMPHFDTKLRIEKHIRGLPLTATIVRPVAFMDMLVMPGFGLDRGIFLHRSPSRTSRCSFWRPRTLGSSWRRSWLIQSVSAARPSGSRATS